MVFKLSWNISVKEIFSSQELKILFNEILLQKKSPHASLVLLFKLRYKEIICKTEKCVLSWTVKINIWWSNQYTEAVFQIFFKIGVLKNFSNLTRNYLCRSLFLIVVLPQDLQLCKKETPAQMFFFVKFAKFLRTSPAAASEFCSRSCVRIVILSNIKCISNPCGKVNV